MGFWTKNLIAFITIAGLLSVFLVVNQHIAKKNSSDLNKSPLMGGTRYPQIKPVGSFELIDHLNRPFTEANLQGKWHLIFMGFTHCPHICPTEMRILKTIYERLPTDRKNSLQIIFVSTDPLRDTPDVINNYLKKYHDDFIGLTGTKEQIAHFARLFSMPFMPSKETDKNKNYDVNHSVSFYLTAPQAQHIALFSTPHDTEKIHQDLLNLLSY